MAICPFGRKMLDAAPNIKRHFERYMPAPPYIQQLNGPVSPARIAVLMTTKIGIGNVINPTGPRHIERICNFIECSLPVGKLLSAVNLPSDSI
jgi:hypothetical protein